MVVVSTEESGTSQYARSKQLQYTPETLLIKADIYLSNTSSYACHDIATIEAIPNQLNDSLALNSKIVSIYTGGGNCPSTMKQGQYYLVIAGNLSTATKLPLESILDQWNTMAVTVDEGFSVKNVKWNNTNYAINKPTQLSHIKPEFVQIIVSFSSYYSVVDLRRLSQLLPWARQWRLIGRTLERFYTWSV